MPNTTCLSSTRNTKVVILVMLENPIQCGGGKKIKKKKKAKKQF